MKEVAEAHRVGVESRSQSRRRSRGWVWTVVLLLVVGGLIVPTVSLRSSRDLAPVERVTAATVPEGAWTAPEWGTILVLDEHEDAGSAWIRLLDGRTGDELGAYELGSQPDFAVSPSGRRLYVGFSRDGVGRFQALDPSTGRVTYEFDIPNRANPLSPRSTPDIASSLDDERIYVITTHVATPEEQIMFSATHVQALTAYKANTGELLSEARVAGCGYSRFLPVVESTVVHIFCPVSGDLRTGEVRTFDFGGTDVEKRVLPISRAVGGLLSDPVQGIVWGTPGETIVGVTEQGRLFEVDIRDGRLIRQRDVRLARGESVPLGAIATAGDEMVLGVDVNYEEGELAESERALVVDRSTFEIKQSIDLSRPIWTFAGGVDSGPRFVGVSRATGSVVAIGQGVASERVLGEGIAFSPLFAIVWKG